MLMMVDNHLVGGIPTTLKNMTSSVGMMKFPIYGKIKFMFQTTNQASISICLTFGKSDQWIFPFMFDTQQKT